MSKNFVKPRIENFEGKKFLGKSAIMSFAHNSTGELWRSFMPERDKIKNRTGSELYSVQIYPAGFFSNFNPDAEFEKWAAAEVSDFKDIPADMKTLIVPSGLYAVFLYKGAADKAGDTYRYIIGTWIPASAYELDARPHFEIMGEKYKNKDPESEEEIWLPVIKIK